MHEHHAAQRLATITAGIIEAMGAQDYPSAAALIKSIQNRGLAHEVIGTLAKAVETMALYAAMDDREHANAYMSSYGEYLRTENAVFDEAMRAVSGGGSDGR